MTDELTRLVAGGRDAFFENAESDRLLAMMMRFMTSHWALQERVMVLEKLLAENGTLEAGAVENFRPDAETDAQWDARSFAFIQAIIDAQQNIES